MKKVIQSIIILSAMIACKEVNLTPQTPSTSSIGVSSAKVAAYAFDFPATNANKFAQYASGNYTAFNNVWNSAGIGQRFAGSSSQNFEVLNCNQPTNPVNDVKAYSHIRRFVNRKISALSTLKSTFNITRPTSGTHKYNTAYDVWLGTNDKYEIMLWMNSYGGAGPLKDDYSAPAPYSNINVGGHTWTVWRKYWSNSGKYVYSFVRTSNTNSGTIDIRAILNWCRNTAKTNGTPWLGDENVSRVEGGFEIFQSSNGTFKMNSFSVTY